MPTKQGKYSSGGLGKDKVRYVKGEHDWFNKEDARNWDHDDTVNGNSTANGGLSAPIKQGK